MKLINDSTAAHLLCSAFEGGSNEWYMIKEYKKPETVACPWGGEYTPDYISFPFSEGGAVIIVDIEDQEGPEYTLDKKAVENGISIITTDTDYSHHYKNILEDNADAETGDVFLQLCVFSDVIYG